MGTSDLSGRRGNREQGTGNRNGGWCVDYENVHAAGATPFSNECSSGVYVAATGFSRISRLILSRKRFLCPGCIVSRAAFPVSCSSGLPAPSTGVCRPVLAEICPLDRFPGARTTENAPLERFPGARCPSSLYTSLCVSVDIPIYTRSPSIPNKKTPVRAFIQ